MIITIVYVPPPSYLVCLVLCDLRLQVAACLGAPVKETVAGDGVHTCTFIPLYVMITERSILIITWRVDLLSSR